MRIELLERLIDIFLLENDFGFKQSSLDIFRNFKILCNHYTNYREALGNLNLIFHSKGSTNHTKR